MSKWMVAAKKADFYAIAQQYHSSPGNGTYYRNRDVIEGGGYSQIPAWNETGSICTGFVKGYG